MAPAVTALSGGGGERRLGGHPTFEGRLHDINGIRGDITFSSHDEPRRRAKGTATDPVATTGPDA
jgi:hypothetical protein